MELSQLSIRQYARPNGEVVALLVMAPSKTDRERVIPMTPELFHVIATINRRLTRNRQGVPLATRFDKLERITCEPEPFLFQRTIGQRTEVITPETVRAELAKLTDALAVEHPELAGCRFTPHDFRCLFATDLVNHGLPIHIGAALLGHHKDPQGLPQPTSPSQLSFPANQVEPASDLKKLLTDRVVGVLASRGYSVPLTVPGYVLMRALS